MKKINLPLLIGIYLLSIFFILQFVHYIYFNHYAPDSSWESKAGQVLYYGEIISIIIVVIAFVTACSMIFKDKPFLLVPLLTFTLPAAWFIYILSYGATSQNFFYFELAMGILLLIMGLVLQIRRKRVHP